ncbi:hypothetical protein ACTPDT_11595 [Clostridioides difficile]|uniref:hypothetical protein n=1 Tax=Clostridioides difficile TaxID=1496 RepID=UPI000AA9503D|nr:hypothetical protein [Clostridioides difficile]MCI4264537.1 hypothetical protein [Clostridioides difficile]MCX4224697.1 hypothetical protein [Clostridioides difficile]MDU8809499.1 hypothetical protein [Clostridioides difficile]MDV9669107.1 hypothetical protein [Clostridioides difficile]MDV9697770.1 hypothetical protein [Clostridioides difficile]
MINDLKKGVFDKTIVINNRYDGVDLSDESFRLLIIGSIPYLNDYADKYKKNAV